jgi:pyridoxine 5-phosphate synthase
MRLHINIDHVATLRNQRDTPYPDPVAAARLCMNAGADGITVHLREDRRHIRDADVRALSAAKLGLLNLEMAPTEEMIGVVREIRPSVVTLVPEKREERTTEGGLDVLRHSREVERVASVCREMNVRLSLFIEASEEQVRASRELGAAQVEFHTGHYCEAVASQKQLFVDRMALFAKLATDLELDVAAGHGLHCENVAPIAQIEEIVELNIGHSIVSEAVLVGMTQAVSNMRATIERARVR